jgi:hypothetical protein
MLLSRIAENHRLAENSGSGSKSIGAEAPPTKDPSPAKAGLF